MCAVKTRYAWGPKEENKLGSEEQLEWKLHLMVSKRKVNWVKLLSGLFPSSWVTTCVLGMCLLPSHSQSFIIARLLRAFRCPTWKNMDALAWRDRFSFLWVLNINSELASRKDGCRNTHGQTPWEAERKTLHHYSLPPYYLGSWEVGKNSALTILSVYFCYLCTV